MKDLYLQLCRVKRDKRVVMIGVGNKIDLVEHRQMKKEDAEAYFNPPVAYFETSCKTGENVKEVLMEQSDCGSAMQNSLELA